MISKRVPMLSSLMHFVTIAAVAAAVSLVFYTYVYGPAGGSFGLRSIHYTFEALHAQGMIFYPLVGLALASWIFRPSPRTSSAGR